MLTDTKYELNSASDCERVFSFLFSAFFLLVLLLLLHVVHEERRGRDAEHVADRGQVRCRRGGLHLLLLFDLTTTSKHLLHLRRQKQYVHIPLYNMLIC